MNHVQVGKEIFVRLRNEQSNCAKELWITCMNKYVFDEQEATI